MNKLTDLPLINVLGKYRQYVPAQNAVPKGNIAYADHLVGVEIELEDFRDGQGGLDKIEGVWEEHQEGSLVNGREFVLFPPKNGGLLSKAINLFFNAGFRYTGGERCSVHIHVDMLDGYTVGNFRAMLALTYLIEGAIYRIADENRKWAGYSCPLIDMSPSRLNNLLCAETPATFSAACSGKHHEDKYYGFNAVSLKKHGTLEFRYFPCTDDREVLTQWINLVTELKVAGSKFQSAEQLLAGLEGPDDVAQLIRNTMPVSAEAILMYLDTPDAAQRVNLLSAILHDKNACAMFKPPRNAGNNKLIARVVNKMRGIEAAAQEEIDKKLKRPIAKQLEELIRPDGQVDEAAFHKLLLNVRGRVKRLNDNIN